MRREHPEWFVDDRECQESVIKNEDASDQQDILKDVRDRVASLDEKLGSFSSSMNIFRLMLFGLALLLLWLHR
jgi:hypothetical protein